ncbi:MAG: amidase [Acidimicrobiales bacterium]
MTDIPKTITEAAALLRSGALTSAALTEACFAVADRLDGELGTYISRYDETALAAAVLADEELAAGIDKGPLHGIPIGIKDIIACREGRTTGQSLVFDPAWWAGEDAPVVERLRAAGAVITGKLTTMEYACGLPDPSKGYPTPRNPWDTTTWPGGSSSGSGSGVSAGMFLGALGTDTGGSVRMPAAFCGITGMKQTYGLVPKAGCLPLGVTLDHIGPMTRSAADAAAMLAVMAGYDASDPSMPPGVSGQDYPAMLSGDLTGVTIGVERAHHLGRPGCDPALVEVFESAVAALGEAGATVVEVSIPYYDELALATMLCWPVEAFAFHRQWLAERWTDYGRWTRSVIGAGALLTAADYAQALKVRRIGKAALDELFTTVDLIVSPTCTAGAIGYDRLNWDNLMHTIFTPYWDAVGNPALTVPMGFTGAGLPLGLQIAGRPFEDGLVFRAGDAYQRLTAHHLQVPAMAATALA